MALYPGSNEVACTCYSQSLVVGRCFISLGLYQVITSSFLLQFPLVCLLHKRVHLVVRSRPE